jgi:hypothetical protein
LEGKEETRGKGVEPPSPRKEESPRDSVSTEEESFYLKSLREGLRLSEEILEELRFPAKQKKGENG